MEKPKIPSYYSFRLYVTSDLLSFFLMIPFLIFLGAQNIPEIARNKGFLVNDSTHVESLKILADTLEFSEGEMIDSLLNVAIDLGEEFVDSLAQDAKDLEISLLGPSSIESKEGETPRVRAFAKKGPFSKFFRLLFFLTLASYMAGIIYGSPFKRYFKKLRRKQEIPDKLKRYCKRQLLNTPVVTAVILSIPSIVSLLYALFFI